MASFYEHVKSKKLSPDVIRIGLCVICDFVEKGRGKASDYFSKTIFPALLKYSQSPSPEIIQAAVYGIGACAEFAGDDFKGIYENSVKCIFSVLSKKELEKKFLPSTCNAVSALFKIIKFQTSKYDNANSDLLLGKWFSSLPVSGDHAEASLVHENLISLILAKNSLIVQKKNIPKIFQIFGTILDTDDITDDDQLKLILIMVDLQKSLPKEFMDSVFETLTEDQRENIQITLKRI